MFPNLKYRPSTFFANFLVGKIVRKNKLWTGNGFSSGGGGMGSGSYAIETDGTRFTKHYSYSCHFKSAILNEFNQSEVMRSLRVDVEQNIVASGAKIVNSEDLDISGFYIEYSEEGIKGNIKVTGSISGGNFKLNADLEELTKSQKKPLIEKRYEDYQPVGNYYVVAFDSDDADARLFFEKGLKVVKESRERLFQKYRSDREKGKSPFEMEQVVIYCWRPIPEQVRQYFADMTGENFMAFTEYDQYGKVYFLNELALRMYRDIGADFEVLKVISAEEASKIPGKPTKGYYIPKGE